MVVAHRDVHAGRESDFVLHLFFELAQLLLVLKKEFGALVLYVCKCVHSYVLVCAHLCMWHFEFCIWMCV